MFHKNHLVAVQCRFGQFEDAITELDGSLSLHRQGTSDNEVGDYCDYGDYEDVGTPVVPTRVSLIPSKIS